MIDQMTFDQSEEIAHALHRQEGLALALVNYLANIHLPADQEHVVLALIQAQDQCRWKAAELASRIARSGPH